MDKILSAVMQAYREGLVTGLSLVNGELVVTFAKEPTPADKPKRSYTRRKASAPAQTTHDDLEIPESLRRGSPQDAARTA